MEKDTKEALTNFPESPGKLTSISPRKTPRGLAMQTATMVVAAAARVLLLSTDGSGEPKVNRMTDTETAMVKMAA